MYKALEGGNGIPALYSSGEIGRYVPPFRWIAIELCGPSLEDLFNIVCGRRFTTKTVLMIGLQMLSIIEFIHNKNIIHRDLKPDNFVMGLYGKCHQVMVVDMGLAKEYKNGITGAHIPFSKCQEMSGTARYASLNTHRGYEQSRRDDLETIGYIMFYFLRGRLPWQDLQTETETEKDNLITEMVCFLF